MGFPEKSDWFGKEYFCVVARAHIVGIEDGIFVFKNHLQHVENIPTISEEAQSYENGMQRMLKGKQETHGTQLSSIGANQHPKGVSISCICIQQPS
ncbi:hypothetical protein CEXT_332041 [Caerostris extrusa]|uniref:Uncharacterized protein n=1 Tax=Caerostris extrusa TaxID=172846 RepID=A0AAV4RNF0_CAEEX|nr:hypothetical protein CEXT_332041 [Caerostris extrusa]